MNINKHVQGTVFGNSVPELGEEVGYRSSVVASATGLTQRQIDYWAKRGFYVPSLNQAKGSGTRRLYTFRDICILRTYKRLLDTGLPIRKIQQAQQILKDLGVDDLSSVTLCSDAHSIYLVNSPEEIFDLLKGGQGVFSISISSIWFEMENLLQKFNPSTTAEEEIPPFLREVCDMIEAKKNVARL